MQRDPNYGRPEEEPGRETDGARMGGRIGGGPTRVTSGPVGMSAQDERTWSMLAHLSVLVSIITVIGGPIAALVIWLVYKDRSRRVAFHALQSLWYQVAWLVIFAVYGVITVVLSVVTFGLASFVLVPLAFVLALVPLIHQCYAAYKVYQGVNYRYPMIADVVDRGRMFA